MQHLAKDRMPKIVFRFSLDVYWQIFFFLGWAMVCCEKDTGMTDMGSLLASMGFWLGSSDTYGGYNLQFLQSEILLSSLAFPTSAPTNPLHRPPGVV
jgi:hypothetical protein